MNPFGLRNCLRALLVLSSMRSILNGAFISYSTPSMRKSGVLIWLGKDTSGILITFSGWYEAIIEPRAISSGVSIFGLLNLYRRVSSPKYESRIFFFGLRIIFVLTISILYRGREGL